MNNLEHNYCMAVKGGARARYSILYDHRLWSA